MKKVSLFFLCLTLLMGLNSKTFAASALDIVYCDEVDRSYIESFEERYVAEAYGEGMHDKYFISPRGGLLTPVGTVVIDLLIRVDQNQEVHLSSYEIREATYEFRYLRSITFDQSTFAVVKEYTNEEPEWWEIGESRPDIKAYRTLKGKGYIRNMLPNNANWQFYSEDEDQSSYFETASFQKTSNNSYIVLIKQQLTDAFGADLGRNIGHKVPIAYRIFKMEVNFKENKSRIVAQSQHAKNGTVLYMNEQAMAWQIDNGTVDATYDYYKKNFN